MDTLDNLENLTPTQEKLKTYKEIVEGNIIGCIWKTPELLLDYDFVLKRDFLFNKWRVFFQIIYDLKIVEDKTEIDENTVNLYLEKHLQLREKYNEYGGYETITLLSNKFTNINNMQSYVSENDKWRIVLQLMANNYPLSSELLKKFVDMNIEDIYDYYDFSINNIFSNAFNNIEAVSIADNLDKLKTDIINGDLIGLPYDNMPSLTKLTNGLNLSSITLLGAPTGAGKSTFLRNIILPSILNHKERIVIYLNEEPVTKWQREYITWVCNNILLEPLEKFVLRTGKISPQGIETLDRAIEWIKQTEKDNRIILIPLKEYRNSTIIRTTKKFCSQGVKYFAIDTFKPDIDGGSGEKQWAELEKNMVRIDNLARERKLHFFVTLQLKLADVRERYLTLDNTAKAKGVAEVASCYLMIRKVWDDEFPDQKRELKIYRSEGRTEVPVILESTKKYMLVFLCKNREGECGERQIVIETDMSRNVYKEIGYTKVPFN